MNADARGSRRSVTCAVCTIAALVSFCSPALAAGRSSVTGPGCNPQLPVVAHHAGGKPVALGRAALPVACANDTGYTTSESTLAVTNTGAIFYSPANTENSVVVSQDQGATWKLSYPPDEQYTSLWNTDDPFLTVDRRTGRIFWSHATGDLRTFPVLVSNSPLPGSLPTGIAYAHGFQVYSTGDDGRTWRTASNAEAPTADQDHLAVGPPPPASTGAPQPSGYPDVVYMCAAAPAEVAGPGQACYKSLDGGATFSFAGYIFPSLSQPPDACVSPGANTAVVASNGTLYHPVTCLHAAYLAVSRDEGSSYRWLQVPGAPPLDVNPSNLSAITHDLHLAIDHADNLYGLWVASDHLYLVVSRDGGQHWSSPMNVTGPGLHNITLPAFAAGPKGQVGITYYASKDPSAKHLTAYITQTTDALAAQPLFYTGALNDQAHPIFENYSFNASPRADYIGGGYDSHGTFWAGVVRQFGVPGANNYIATTGYVGRLNFPATTSAGALKSHKRTKNRHVKPKRDSRRGFTG